MSEFEESFYDDDDDQPVEPPQNPVRARMKQLEKEAKELRRQVAEFSQASREMNFVKAGIQTDDPKFKYFVKGYDGDLTPEAIRRAAEEAQLITPQQTVEDTDKQGWKQSNQIAAGSETAPPGPSWNKRIQDAVSEEEVYAIFAEAQAQGIEL
jgi:hypothetical protein